LPRIAARRRAVPAVLLIALSVPAAGSAQDGPPPSPVRTTAVIEHEIRRTVELPGTVEARTESQVATEVEGLVATIHAREGAAVAKGAPLVSLRRDNLELRLASATGQLQEAEARLADAERDLARSRQLREDDLLSEGELENAQADAVAWQGRVMDLQADLDRTRLDLERSTIRAPFDGVVTEELTDVGSWIHVGDPVAGLIATGQLEVRVEAPDRWFPQFRTGEAVRVTVDADPPFHLTGKVTAVVPRADARSRIFPVKVTLDDASAPVVAGMLARVSIPVGEGRSAILVPKDALVSQGPGSIVYVLADDGQANAVPVVPGQGAGVWVAVEGDLQPGQDVIVRGNERIFPGQRFQGEPLEYPLP
jgi:RND family efflux transporter MFP subunit